VRTVFSQQCYANQDPAFVAHKTEPTPFVEGSWTVVVIPDTQNYLVGKKVSERVLDAMPVFDGMSGAGDESFGRHQAELADDQTRE